MQGKKKPSVCTGCWRQMLLSCVLALHLIPLYVHGTVLKIIATEPDNKVNITSPLIEEEGPVNVNDVIATVTGMSTSATSAPISPVTPRAGRIPRGGKEDDDSSGMFADPVVPTVEKMTLAATPHIIPDSAETDLLLPSNPRRQDVLEGEEEGDEEVQRLPHTDPPWIHVKETAMFDLDHLTTTTALPAAATNPSNPDVLHVDFFDPSSRGRNLDLAPPSPSSLAHELQGGDATSWAMPENYDYLTPYEDGMTPTVDKYSYSTTSNAYESDEDLREAVGSPARSRPRVPGSGSFNPGGPDPGAVPDVSPNGCQLGSQRINGSCRSVCLSNYCLNGGRCYQLTDEEIFCRCNVQDYIWHKGARCESVVTEFQVMCLTVGASAVVVLLFFMIIVCFAKKLHVLKRENKKLRKRSSKYRPSSEQHNDNFSLSTIAEGSHPNVRKLCETPPNVPHARALAYYDNIICQDDPHSQNKLEDPVKAPPKEDDSLNIHNSLTPKHENHKVLGEENSSEVNSLQNNMM
ncbi:chondroitin sulfate proteoglycan 5 isoform X3 [Girardinichthys multiradiatus]|uniref:chondroitin sulfate proteoglycan 5 isoform X3 n=1 Tax=Girardinichthys multiradiatus TaxID=208333 RepID=UPI001FABD63B|nr:chondroitin sulfate proteoglycan 5 isoform X3 [Girardinichthys multiradiatus]